MRYDWPYIRQHEPNACGFRVGLSNELLYLPHEYSYECILSKFIKRWCAREVVIIVRRSEIYGIRSTDTYELCKFILRTYYVRRIPLHKQVGCAAPPLPKPRTRAPGETVNSFAMHLRQ